jgi:thiol-disulfide isomerase/thioredoxin
MCVSRHHRRSLGIALAFLAGCIGAQTHAAPANVHEDRAKTIAMLEGKPAPALHLINWVNGDPVTLNDVRGKVLVLEFWATWCAPCIAHIPRNNALAEKYRDRGVILVGICHALGSDKMDTVVLDKGIKYRAAQDSRGATIKAYAVDGLPQTSVIDRRGVLRVADCPRSKIERVIESLLNEP